MAHTRTHTHTRTHAQCLADRDSIKPVRGGRSARYGPIMTAWSSRVDNAVRCFARTGVSLTL